MPGPVHQIDFTSNDYLGFARSLFNSTTLLPKLEAPNFRSGATGSRLLTGNPESAAAIEAQIAHFHQAEAALVFPSGYAANLGLYSCIADRNDTLIYDGLVHASIRDGIRLSNARSFSFRHNDLDDLRLKIRNGKGKRIVAVEALYSMDGDLAPLTQLAALCQEEGTQLIVDEAHSLGVYGSKGQGLLAPLELEHLPIARIYTFGKSMGIQGAAIVGSQLLKEYLVNFSRPFIYTTGLSPINWIAIEAAYNQLEDSHTERQQLQDNIHLFCQFAQEQNLPVSGFSSPIQSLIVPGNEKVKQLSKQLLAAGFDLRPILHPTVAKGKERLRICLHAFNTEQEIQQLVAALAEGMKNLGL